MRSTSWRECEYLNGRDEKETQDAALVQEMSRRLDALRRYDQHFCKPIGGHLRLSGKYAREEAEPQISTFESMLSE